MSHVPFGRDMLPLALDCCAIAGITATNIDTTVNITPAPRVSFIHAPVQPCLNRHWVSAVHRRATGSSAGNGSYVLSLHVSRPGTSIRLTPLCDSLPSVCTKGN